MDQPSSLWKTEIMIACAILTFTIAYPLAVYWLM